MKNIYFLSLLLLALAFIIGCSSNRIFAQEGNNLIKGAEKPAFQNKTETTQCFVFSQYMVKTASGADVGEDILVYKRALTSAAANCATKSRPLFTIKNPDANYFIGLSGNFLFIDSGTSVESRGLEIYNLTTHKSIFSSEYQESVKLVQNKFVIYDKISKQKGVLKNCSQAAEWKRNGMSIGWVRDSKLDLQTLKETPIGTLRCYALQ